MLKVAMSSRKGGTGKTTLALSLSVAAKLAGRSAAVVDLDPQATAMDWFNQRGLDEPLVTHQQPAQLGPVLSTIEAHGGELALLDLPPHSEAATLAAARAADLVLIPCRPAIFDLRAIEASADVAALAQTPAVVVLNAVQPRGDRNEDAEAAIRDYGLEVAPVRIGHRVAFVDAATRGQTVQEHEAGGKAAAEVGRLYEWLLAYARKDGLVREEAAA